MVGASWGNRFVFPAPDPSYGPQSYRRHLCWIPWNAVISPDRVKDPGVQDGIPCLWFPAPKAATVILFFHANAEDLGMSFAILKHMRDQFKVNVLAAEYPGYGLLHHVEPSEDGVCEVALTTFRFLVDVLGVRYSQIVLFGRSLGSGPAVFLASQFPVGGLILVSAFSSIRAAVQSIAGRFFAMAFQERFPNHKTIANVSCSTLFIHGESDGLIPVEHSVKLFKRCRARKLLVTPPEMEHNSNLFGDASFLAIPAIHFFGFPGYYTSTPPRLPASMFETPDRRLRLAGQAQQEGTARPFLCDCLAKRDQHSLEAGFGRQADGVDNITICLYKDTTDEVELAGDEAKERLKRMAQDALQEKGKEGRGKSHAQAEGDLGEGELEQQWSQEDPGIRFVDGQHAPGLPKREDLPPL
ncbi:aho-3 [Symbiodinium natans]|uniref:Aho-3 protein n=1 Tax=Symbiodinium natans TaxID=878477 RepID=A0A812NME6_9DINO|nr:aho-3 [Symbiodinium natans]